MKEIAKALITARSTMGKLLKDGKNPHFKSKYATLKAVIETAQGPLADAGIAVLEYTSVAEDGATMQHLDLIHAESGDSLPSQWSLKVKDPTNPQQVGSAQTYARRYLWTAAAGIAPEDDDGQAASHAGPQQTTPQAHATVDQSKDKAAKAKALKGFMVAMTTLEVKNEDILAWIKNKGKTDIGSSADLSTAQLIALTVIAKAQPSPIA